MIRVLKWLLLVIVIGVLVWFGLIDPENYPISDIKQPHTAITGNIYLSTNNTPIEGRVWYVQMSGEYTPRTDKGDPLPPAPSVNIGNNGTYSIYNLNPGEYRLSAQLVLDDGSEMFFSQGSISVLVENTTATKNIDIYVFPSGSISGYVFDADSKTPIAGVDVVLLSLSEDHGSLKQPTTITNNQGFYIITNIPPGEYIPGVFAQGYNGVPFNIYDESIRVGVTSGLKIIDMNYELISLNE